MEFLQGTLDLLLLRALADGPLHGYGVQRRLEELSAGSLRAEEGSLYPSLYRMESRGWVASAWGRSENNRKARFYRITPAGRRQLTAEDRRWVEFSSAVERVLGRP